MALIPLLKQPSLTTKMVLDSLTISECQNCLIDNDLGLDTYFRIRSTEMASIFYPILIHISGNTSVMGGIGVYEKLYYCVKCICFAYLLCQVVLWVGPDPDKNCYDILFR